MKSNEELMKNVLNAINWEPFLHAAEIGVIVKDGVIKLTGSVDTYAKKAKAEKAAKNVLGVKKVFEDIIVVCKTSDKKTDAEIRIAIEKIFNLHWDIATEKITVIVKNSWVFLNGELEWEYQKEATTEAVKNLIGITGITNKINSVKATNDRVKKCEIENRLERNYNIDKDIGVAVLDDVVTLKGQVASLFQKKEAERIAGNVTGVKWVKNDLNVDLDK